MTNLIATIIITLNTNWTATQKIVPICTIENCDLQHTELIQEIGQVITNTTVRFKFEGKSFDLLVKQEKEKLPSLKRETPSPIDLHPKWVIGGNGVILVQ